MQDLEDREFLVANPQRHRPSACTARSFITAVLVVAVVTVGVFEFNRTVVVVDDAEEDNTPTRPPTQITGPVRIACVGDSITFGDGSFLGSDLPLNTVDERYIRGSYPKALWDVLNKTKETEVQVRSFAVSGTTALKYDHSSRRGGCLPYSANAGSCSFWDSDELQAAKEFNPHIVAILFGTNDSNEDELIDQFFRDDYFALVDFLCGEECNLALILVPPGVYSSKFATNEQILASKIRPLVRNVTASFEDTELVDIQRLIALDTQRYMGVATSKKTANAPENNNHATKAEQTGDGIHPQAQGATVIGWCVYEFIAEVLGLAPLSTELVGADGADDLRNVQSVCAFE